MKIVADTNSFLAVALCEPERDDLIRAVEGHDLIAPEVLPFEIGNALTAMSKRRRLDPDEVLVTWAALNRIPVALQKVDLRAALEIAISRGLYAYDAYFLECAARYRAPLLTLDTGLRQAARDMAVPLLEISN